jgi:GT2 family glycosyltransferase
LNARPKKEHVCAVIVTYGNNRAGFVNHSVKQVLSNGIGHVVIVDNGSSEEDRKLLEELKSCHGENISVINLGENRGSSGGYKAGIQYALTLQQVELLWLLDDDNAPDDGALDALLDAYAAFQQTLSDDEFMLLSLRIDREHLRRLANGAPLETCFPKLNSFVGFHVMDIPKKLKKKLTGRVTNKLFIPTETLKSTSIPYAPYGGLFLSRSVVRRIGHPLESLFVYADDTEYTNRLVRSGGSIFLVPTSIVRDLDASWQSQANSNMFSRFVGTAPEFRVYHLIRNQVYFERNFWVNNRLMFFLNKCVFLFLTLVYSVILRRMSRYSVIRRAVSDARNLN